MGKNRTGLSKEHKSWRLSRTFTLPGTLISAPEACPSVVSLILYNAETVFEERLSRIETLKNFVGKKSVMWVDVEGLGNERTIESIGEVFKIHPLVLEDIVAGHQRPKLEQYDDKFFLVLQVMMLTPDMMPEQLSMVIGNGFVVTFHENKLDCLEVPKERIRKKLGSARNEGPDYLAYMIIDSVIDSYFPILEQYGEDLETLEDEIIENLGKETIARIHTVKRNLLSLRRALWPAREAINGLLRDGAPLFTENTAIHMHDCYDHTVRLIDFTETYRELGADLMDVYLSNISNRLNEVMKVLTIITTIFVPPTFIAGIYGMNFKSDASPYNMPELGWYYGYPYALLLMLIVTGLVLVFLWWKGWLSVLGFRSHRSGGGGMHGS